MLADSTALAVKRLGKVALRSTLLSLDEVTKKMRSCPTSQR